MKTLKYVDTKVVFAEVPDEITLAISISGCPCKCKGCHSSYLIEDIGEELTISTLEKLITENKGITCVAFMGGDVNPKEINNLASWIKSSDYNLKVAWYSGRPAIPIDIHTRFFDYIKTGPYEEDKGPLTKRTTNQRFYKVVHNSMGIDNLYDMTHKFWKHDNTED